MTGQISDTFNFRGDSYSLIGIKDGELFSPEQFDMTPIMIHTACYRGFYATYELTGDTLYLKELTINEACQNYPTIEGVVPAKSGPGAERTYHGLNVEVPFTGKIRLAKYFIQQLYIHMGFQKPTAFKTVLDIALKDGKVVEIRDRSREVK